MYRDIFFLEVSVAVYGVGVVTLEMDLSQV